jgi:two-component system response regulator QseB
MRVLLIEDDEILGDGLKAGLEQTGYVVDWVRNGTAGQSALRAESFDIVLLDLGLPGMPGIDVLRWLRSRGDLVSVLILTATDGVAERVTALDTGADDYMSKPFDLDELCARLRALRRRALGTASPVFRHRGIEIDPAVRSVTHDGQPVSLSPKEFAILQTLIEDAGKAVPRQRLMGQIDGSDEDVGGNALEVHIHNIRKKLALANITTIRGVGYRLD